MRPRSPLSNSYACSVLSALAIIFAITGTAIAQLSTFNPSFEGELWGVRRTLMPANDAVPAGVAFSGGTLFVADSANRTLIAYDNAGQVVSIPNAAWNMADPASPVFGLIPHQLAAITVRVNGASRNALLVSDEKSNRVAAFRVSGEYLFTLRLQRPTVPPTLKLTIGQLAMSPGARFNLTTASSTLTLTGTFAAAWREQLMTGEVNTGALVYREGAASFALSGSEFIAASSAVLTGLENNPASPAPQNIFGVSFDTAGNLYVLDALTERLHVYAPDLTRLFTFGTPVADGTTAEFYEPWGMLFWPDAAGTSGRLLVNDTYNGRVVAFRPVDGNDADTVIDSLQQEMVIDHFVSPVMELFAIAVDSANGTLALTDFAVPRVVILQRPRLGAFNIEVLNSSDQVVDSVCTATQYKVRFSLTVPSGLATVSGVVPQLTLNGVAAGNPAGAPSPTSLAAGQVATYTYTLIAPAQPSGDIAAVAGATSSSTTDILQQAKTIPLANCAGETDPSTVTAAPSMPPQISGWTPVFPSEVFHVTLTAQDDDGIASIEYQLAGVNSTTEQAIAAAFDGDVTDAVVDVPLPEVGRTEMQYRVRDGNGIWTTWQVLNVRTKLVPDRITNENVAAEFRVGDPEGGPFTYSVSGLPAGVTFAAATGQFAGVVSFDAVQPYSPDPVLSSGVYHVVVTETASNGASSNVAFTWTINHVNREPIIENPATQGLSIQQGAPFVFQIVGADPDGDPALFTMNARGVNNHQDAPLSIDPVTGLITGTFPLDADTDYEIHVALAECLEQTAAPPCNRPVFPGVKLATHVGFNVAVLDANLSPDILNPGPQSSAEGATIALQLQFSDAEGDALTFAATGLPPGLGVNNDGLISGTVSFAAAGVYAVTIAVDDPLNAPRLVSFAWTVTHTNRPPVVTIPDQSHIEGTAMPAGASFGGFATDPDHSPVTFTSIAGLPPGISMTATGAVSGSFGYFDAGVYTVSVTVSDGAASTNDTFIWTVHNVNRAPTLTPANQVNREGDVVSYLLPASDPDGDALIFSINGLPSDLSLNTATGLISGTLGPNAAGVYTVNIGVADIIASNSQSLLRTITWTVRDPNDNRAPVANADSATVTQLASVSIDVRANDTDADGDALTIVGVTAPTSGTATINPATGRITFTAASPAFVGVSTFAYIVTDGLTTATGHVQVTILANNAPPVCAAATGGEIWPPNHKKFYLAPINGVSDPDGNPISITVTGILQDEQIDSTGDGQFAPDGRIADGQAWVRAERNGHGNKASGNGRVYEILFTASDNHGGTCNGSVFWTVPHDQSQRSTAIDDGIRYDSTGAVAGARDQSQIHGTSAKP